MIPVRKVLLWTVLLGLCLVLPPIVHRGAVETPAAVSPGVADEYLVLYAAGVAPGEARAAIEAAGGQIVRENTAVGDATVRATRHDGVFLRVIRQSAAGGGARGDLAFRGLPP